MLLESFSVLIHVQGTAMFKKIRENDTLVIPKTVTIIFCTNSLFLNFIDLGGKCDAIPWNEPSFPDYKGTLTFNFL